MIFSLNTKFHTFFLYFCIEKTSFCQSMSESSQHILQRVSTYIQQQHLLDASPRTLYVGLSGGPDSVALLHLLKEFLVSGGVQVSGGFQVSGDMTLVALHCNFHLRGAESDRDQHFCEQLCHQLGIELRVKEFDTRAYMQEHHLSLEMAARQLRYAWWRTLLQPPSQPPFPTHLRRVSQPPFPTDLRRASQPPSPPLLALGHHQDDSLETLLMNLMRGTGIQGLTGIVPHNEETHVIRPLLCLTRQEILDYLADNHLTYVTDSTNAEPDTLRNQVRNQLLPLMEQLLPQARQGLSTTMQHLQQTADLADLAIQHYIAQHSRTCQVDGYTYEVLDAPAPYPYQTAQYYERRGYHFDGQVALPAHQPLPEAPLPDPDQHETFDRAKLQFPLRWRRWQQGDRMAPLGMNGHTKLLSDLFTNAHYLPIQKQLAWVLEDAAGQILWVPGLRLCHHARLTSETKDPITLHYGEDLKTPQLD